MRALKGQRWRWANYTLVEILVDSTEFSLVRADNLSTTITCRTIKKDGTSGGEGIWYFGGNDIAWEYLKGQDAPLDKNA
jgi:hypothetical protein